MCRPSRKSKSRIAPRSHRLILTSLALMLAPAIIRAADDFPSSPLDRSTTSDNRAASGSPFVWQPLPLRATFRPLRRQPSASTISAEISGPAAPRAPRPPRPPSAPVPPEPLALTLSERSISSNADSPNDNLFTTAPNVRFNSDASSPFSSSFFQPPFDLPPTTSTTTSAAAAPTTTLAPTPRPADLDDELPTRQPMNRFRPTRVPSDDAETSSSLAASAAMAAAAAAAAAAAEVAESGAPSIGGAELGPTSGNSTSRRRMSSECLECICEASTSCNANSRCQTSDVRHTRCGLFLISYDQWLATGLSRELVSASALARDAAADERAFYECVTQRDCAERLLEIYMSRNQKDCDQDGRVDCYDMAAIHHSGKDQCASEALLDSQFWNDFNACLGFGR